MRQKYHFATDNGILIWDVTSILEDIEQHPDSYIIQTLSTALLADHNDARVSHTRHGLRSGKTSGGCRAFQRSFAADRRQSPSA